MADRNAELANADQPAHIVPGGIGHMKNFLESRETRRPPVASLEEGFISTATCLLGNIAMKVGRTLTWDAPTQTVVGDDAAMGLFQRPYRQPWQYPQG